MSNCPLQHVLYGVHPVRPQSLLPLLFLRLESCPPFLSSGHALLPTPISSQYQASHSFLSFEATWREARLQHNVLTSARNLFFFLDGLQPAPGTFVFPQILFLFCHGHFQTVMSPTALCRNVMQLSTWKHSPLLLHFFSAQSRAVSSFAIAHPHFFIACKKLFTSASTVSLFL